MRTSWNICAYPKYLLMLKIYAHMLKYLGISKISAHIRIICAYLKYMRPIIYDSNKADVEISAPMRNICAQKIGAQTLTIWARQNLQLLTSSKSGWRALVQVMLSLLHAVLKWGLHPGRPAYMGGVSPVLYRYRHDLPKYLRPVQYLRPHIFSPFSWEKSKT